ncbi:twin-arginine translocase TatA/TatE family subunit [Cellulomonas chengniuliangii]|uniref:Sec-independent protein translocase protein TatB n=1 Tax=Cellulomonas chengniuliangii TaxID=2968084 RepID=A0ABY5L195_9CELL|nr:twin-arginine translocase TatA/TatE family subunit [Cellulomonas chengniuliangii]MCC2310169.1 twin-arginine translocase TatA/TatE family subunit [Cellulomonas chengniuliangii]MCC2316409.1 twin-arginine translocase TatA/TatE family subunit [Cellulomonas chengniuliangii]UUI76169.1 twin-arginine translocase TatA/TatE family subunit [Cellulomonas chengniuliangii]
MLDINGGEFILLLVVAVLVIGPERLPKYAEQLGQWARQARGFVQDTKSRVDTELGDDLKDVDWAALDPRRYDPRRIVREALLDDVAPAQSTAQRARASAAPVAAAGTSWRASTPAPAPPVAADGAPAPYDDEAT